MALKEVVLTRIDAIQHRKSVSRSSSSNNMDSGGSSSSNNGSNNRNSSDAGANADAANDGRDYAMSGGSGVVYMSPEVGDLGTIDEVDDEDGSVSS